MTAGRRVCIEDCSEGFLKAMEQHLLAEIEAGRSDLRPLLDKVQAAIPTAPQACLEDRRSR